jgi:VIT1/CCC1 family predicted Fe2+/Mn2+ transporter
MEQGRSSGKEGGRTKLKPGIRNMIVTSLVSSALLSFLAHTGLWPKVVYVFLVWAFGADFAGMTNAIFAFFAVAFPLVTVYFLNTLEE